ncbi:hypothetical protein [Alkaliphilus serpentinus]|uniref:Uncharacterized protein n=1 Tax=Alkaliphilus serpentinus TaxID=1482731 RepID=A0A833HNI0_9FIRM|nr:hypothetical protein [Alkaliphilus serpentinus]KAB3529606.1 hypothetical protein F8153_08975 [Alkaliphilus serpentinus]
MAFLKRLTLLIIIFLTYSFILVGCKQSSPEIRTSITISKITQEEYNKIDNSSKPEDSNIDDFRKLYIDVKMTNSKKAVERKITIPNLYIIDKYERVRTTSGGASEQNNIGTEDTAKSMAYIIFDSRGLSEQDIRNLYRESKIYIAHRLRNGDLVEKSISVGNELTFNK